MQVTSTVESSAQAALSGRRMAGIGRSGSETVWDLYSPRWDTGERGPLILVDESGRRTYPREKIVEMAEVGAGALLDSGVQPGDRVALAGRSSAELVAAIGAVARIGAIGVPLNSALTASELSFQLEDTMPKAVLVEASLADTFSGALTGHDGAPSKLVFGGDHPGWEELDFTKAGTVELPAMAVDAVSPALILYTSGTASRPKGVLLSHRSLVEEAYRTAAAWSLRPDDTVFGHYPLHHVAGIASMLFASLAIGAALATGPQFSAARWSQEVRDVEATVLFLVGPQVRMLMSRPAAADDADNQVRMTSYGLAVPLEMEQEFSRRFGTPLYSMSGSTECVGPSYIEATYAEHRWPSLGRPAADRVVAILDESGEEVSFGEEGELCVRGELGSSLMLGYWNRPDAMAEAYRDGWYHTGDIGRMDEEGFVYFVDRKKDVIKRSGENISASEVERVLCEVPGVREAGVVGRPDPIRDEAVVAFVALGDQAPDVEAMLEHCAASLARFKIPDEIKILDELPHTSLGKVEKKQLRQWAAETA